MRRESGMGDMLTTVIFLPIVTMLAVGFIIPVVVRAALEPPADRLVQAYVSKYAAFGTLEPPAYSPDYDSGKTLDVLLKEKLVAVGVMSSEGLTVTCGTIDEMTNRILPGSTEAEANKLVGCFVDGTLNGWPTVGPLMEAAPSIFGTEYTETVVAFTDRGSNDRIR